MKNTKKGIQLVSDFFNKVCQELGKKYFPEVKYYRDDDNCAAVHYHLENFTNGVFGYNLLIEFLAKACNDSKANIHTLVSKHIQDFDGYVYDPTTPDIVFKKFPHSMYSKK